MTINHTWNADRTISITRFHVGWTWLEYEALYLEVKQEILELPHDVYVIWDLVRPGIVPVSALSKFSSYQKRIGMPPNFKGVVIATQRPFLRTMVDAYNRSFGKSSTPVLTAKSVTEAEQLIRARLNADKQESKQESSLL
jgi:hypothetical protein